MSVFVVFNTISEKKCNFLNQNDNEIKKNKTQLINVSINKYFLINNEVIKKK